MCNYPNELKQNKLNIDKRNIPLIETDYTLKKIMYGDRTETALPNVKKKQLEK